ncbi:hypothetical protein GGH92_009470, partial [Coemansia sp. RSA 2673]
MLSSLVKGVLLLPLLLLLPCAAQNDIETNVNTLRAHTLEPPFIDEGFQMRNYDFGGDAIVNTLSHIRLTPDMPSRVGW